MDIPSFLSDLVLFVLPSIVYEGLLPCLLEAMCANRLLRLLLPRDTGDIRDKQTGLPVPSNDPIALAAGIRRALHDRETASRMAGMARDLVL